MQTFCKLFSMLLTIFCTSFHAEILKNKPVAELGFVCLAFVFVDFSLFSPVTVDFA